jgi:hypothetical protein
MFSKHDPRAAALRAVHENRVTVTGTAYDGRPEFLIDDDPAWGLLNELFEDGFIAFDADAALPAPVTATARGVLALTALFGILPATPAAAPVPPEPTSGLPPQDNSVDDATDALQDHSAGEATSRSSGAVTIDYFGLGMQCLDFANGKPFRDAVTRHGYELLIDGPTETKLAAGQPLTGESSYLSVVDPVSGSRFYVLYDDEASSDLESPGFVEILTLMDDYCKAQSQSRLFMAEPETDEEEDELDLWVGEDHPFYGLDFDFTTGNYRRA